MPKKPDLYKRAKGYGRLADLRRNEERELDWRPIPGFPEYEVNQNKQVRRKGTQYPSQPYWYPQRPNEGLFVDFWVERQKYTISIEAIMASAFPKEK